MTHRPTTRRPVVRRIGILALASALLAAGSGAAAASGVSYAGNLSPRFTWTVDGGWTPASDPYRLAELALFASTDRFGGYLSGSATSRGGNQAIELALGEAYVDAYFARVDLRVGRQVVAWGAVDGNNPVDNINPIDATLMATASEPADARIPVTALRAVSYWGDDQRVRAELVLLPEFRGHELPEDPGVSLAVKEPEVDLLAPDWAVRIQRSFDRFDLALSYYDGHERLPTPDGAAGTAAYRPVQVAGVEGAVFGLGDLTFRGEAAYFRTPDGAAPPKDPYLQYALQLEYLWGMETSLMVQYLGSHVSGGEELAAVSFQAGAPLFNLDSRAVALGFRHETTWRGVRPASLAGQAVLGLDRGGFLTMAAVDLSLTDSLSFGLGARTGEGLAEPLAALAASRVWTGVEYSF